MYKISKYIRKFAGNIAKTIISGKYYSKNFSSVPHINCENKELSDKNVLDIVAVSFNNEIVIKQQIRLLKSYMSDPYIYTVADNSSDPEKQKIIKQICEEYGAGYIKLPSNPYTKMHPSLSHGSSLNWIYRNYISRRKADYFGFIDHDIFPVKPVKIIEILQLYPAYGLARTIHEKWFLWPGFCFFNENFAENGLNFMPDLKSGLDTGGGNWNLIFSKMSYADIIRSEIASSKISADEKELLDVEYIDNWLHTYNASHYYADGEGKDSLIDLILNKY